MKKINFLLMSLALLVGLKVIAAEPISKGGTAEEMALAAEHNLGLEMSDKEVTFAPLRPVEDTADFKYLLITGYHSYTKETKATIVKNLPADVKLILLAYPGEENVVKNEFSQWIASDRIIMATHENAGNGFWSRDSFPIPVRKDENGNIGLVSHQYFRKFLANKVLAATVKASLNDHTHYFVGGNLLADSEGQCFSVNSSRLFGLTADQIKQLYGCKKVEILPYAAGIGDVDEVLKPLPGKKVLTNIKSYVPTLQQLGYEVIELPKASGMRTYANTLFIGKTVFMPSYGESVESEAIKVYENLGYKVVPVESKNLSDLGNGSIHCITMAYPKIDVNKLLRMMNAERAN